MSQSKVDKKKYEKKHRKEILRKQKIKKIIAITVTIVVIAAIVGSVAGVKIYKAIPKYVDASGLSEYVDKTWKDSGYDTLFSATASDAEDTADTTENAEDTAREELKTKIYKINQFTAEYYHQNLYKPTAKMAQEYVKKRKLTQSTLETYKIGFSGRFDELYKQLKAQGFNEKEMLESGLVIRNDRGQYIDMYRNRLMIPICDIRGKVIAFGGRVLDDSKPKYINSPENIIYSKGRHLFGLNVAKKGDTKKLLIVEGYMDVISLHQRGITNVVAPLRNSFNSATRLVIKKKCRANNFKF